jgi:hypothetical protein
MGIKDDKNHWLDWAEPCLPWFGQLSTLDFGVPPVPSDNDKEHVGVWVEFEAGRVDHPIWTGVFIYAPVKDGKHDRINVDAASVSPGGSLVAAAADGSAVPGAEVADAYPLQLKKTKELRFVAKAGVDIVIMSDRGGGIVIGPYGIDFIGTFVRANGRQIDASLTNISG